jgi:hypothetical protein
MGYHQKVCEKCGNDQEFWVIQVMRSWVKVDRQGNIISDDGEVEKSYLDDSKYQCAVCDAIYSRSEEI